MSSSTTTTSSSGGGGVRLVLRALRWRWLAKRVFSFSTSSSSTSSASSASPPTSTALILRPKPHSYSAWDIRRFFRFAIYAPALPAPPPIPTPPSPKEEAEDAPQETETPPEAPITASTATPIPQPAPIQLLTPPATPPTSRPIQSPKSKPSPPTPPAESTKPQAVAPKPPSASPPAPVVPARQSYLSHLPPLPTPSVTMSDLSNIHTKLISSFTARSHEKSLPLLASAKLSLLQANALIPSPSTPPQTLSQARDILEIGALTSIYLSDTESFSRYYNYLQPFYKLSSIQPSQNEAKILGLYLLFLLSQGDSAGFHTALEVLNQEGKGDSENGWQWGEYVRYPVTLERWLMEGSYDKVWEATRKNKTPAEEFDVFTAILVSTLRQEIATSAERAYPSLPMSNAKNLLFLDSERDVSQFARERGWDVRDGRIYFPAEDEFEGDVPDSASVAAVRNAVSSGTIIENTIGYANELEQIV